MKNFIKNDHAFTCAHCGAFVDRLKYTSRNHCPHCLYSLHVDDTPGDRGNDCRGLMKPSGMEMDSKRGIILVFTCMKCGAVKRNVSAKDDDYDRILKLSAHEPLDW